MKNLYLKITDLENALYDALNRHDTDAYLDIREELNRLKSQVRWD